MLELLNISKRFDGNVAVDQVSFAIKPGQLTALIGPNGAGKSTLLDIISGFVVPDDGMVKVDAREISRLTPWRRAAQCITRTFQQVRQTDALTSKQNVLLHFRNQRGTSLLNAVLFRLRWARQECELSARGDDIMEQLGVRDLSGRLAGDLSFGQRKLAAIAGVVAHDGQVILLDEPFAGVDMAMADRVSGVLRALAVSGKHVLFVEHNFRLVTLIAERVLAMDHGRLVADGTAREVLASDALMRAYTQ